MSTHEHMIVEQDYEGPSELAHYHSLLWAYREWEDLVCSTMDVESELSRRRVNATMGEQAGHRYNEISLAWLSAPVEARRLYTQLGLAWEVGAMKRIVPPVLMPPAPKVAPKRGRRW